MANFVSINDEIHKNLRICPIKAETQGASLTIVPVMLSEFLKLVVQHPIALTKNKETGQFVCVSIFGFLEGENLFWQNNSWDTLYTPLHIARQPFFLGKNETWDASSEDEQYVVCFDSDSESIQTTDGEALFDSQGNETAYFQQMKSLLAQLLDGEKKTQDFVNKLLELELVQPMRFDITFVNGKSHTVNGMYTIDEVKLNALSENVITNLHSLGYLGYIYTMIASMGQIYAMVQRKNTRLGASEA